MLQYLDFISFIIFLFLSFSFSFIQTVATPSIAKSAIPKNVGKVSHLNGVKKIDFSVFSSLSCHAVVKSVTIPVIKHMVARKDAGARDLMCCTEDKAKRMGAKIPIHIWLFVLNNERENRL